VGFGADQRPHGFVLSWETRFLSQSMATMCCKGCSTYKAVQLVAETI